MGRGLTIPMYVIFIAETVRLPQVRRFNTKTNHKNTTYWLFNRVITNIKLYSYQEPFHRSGGGWHTTISSCYMSSSCLMTEMQICQNMTFYDRHICHKMSFYDIYDGHITVTKYGNMGIKLFVLISVFQFLKNFSFITIRENRKTKIFFFKIFLLYFPV